MVKLTTSSQNDMAVLTIANSIVSLSVVPELGGKIISLKSIAEQYEWLQQSPHDGLIKPEYGDSFVNGFDVGGWDECFPSISKEAYAHPYYSDVLIPDHGELWCLPWQIVNTIDTEEFVSVTLRCQGMQLPYTFERTISLATKSSTFDIKYKLQNHHDYVLPFVWSMHPIFAAEEGMEIQLSKPITHLRTDSSFQHFFNTKQPMIDWVSANNSQASPMLLSTVTAEQSQLATKLISTELTSSRFAGDTSTADEQNLSWVEVALKRQDTQQNCGFRFKTDDISHFGLWLNYHGWSGSDLPPACVIGLEPCLGGADSLKQAIVKDECSVLLANECKTWSLQCFIE